MLRNISPPSTLNLLEFLVPSLICRARAFSIAAAAKPNPASRTLHNDYLLEIRNALGARNITAALGHWRSLKQQKERTSDEDLYRLPEQTERQIATLFATHFAISHDQWTDDMKTTARNFALEAATHDITDALDTLMLDHIERNEPQTVVNLYTSYCQMLKNAADQGTQTVGTEEGLDFSDGEEGDSSFNPGRVSLLLSVTTAHAMKDCFREALDTYLAANVRPPSYRKQKLFQSLRNNTGLSRKVQKYLERLGIASLVSRPTSLSKHIMNIAQPRTSKMLEQLYLDIMDGISGPEPYLATELSGVSSTRRIPMTEAAWTAFQTGFIKCERPDLAARMWDDLAKCGFSPGVTMWTALLDTHADLRDSRQAMATWNRMLEQGVKPDTLSYRAIITALFDDNKPEDALIRFREYHRTCKDNSELAIYVYNTVLRGLLRINRIKDANSLMTIMHKKGPNPDIISYNTFLGYYSRQKDFKELSNVVAQMSAAKIPGDVVTFSTILTALLNVGRKDATATILNLMRKQGIRPNVATYSSIIDHQMRQQTEESLAAALNILDKMEKDESTKPNEVTYTSILSGLYRDQGISRSRAEAVRKDIVARMRRANISFRLPTYHILIRAAMDSRDPKGYLDALALMEEMGRQGLPLTNTVWYILLAGLMHRELWNKMTSSGHEPSPRLEKLINDIIRH
ncbi:hypothetical protein BDZ97DRAFT_1776322 [Flammula alnicola]|nr:hypothetical protein BDZ97DRAFT_1776322 [Flammula alnicola]